jgi:hypothetical protein
MSVSTHDRNKSPCKSVTGLNRQEKVIGMSDRKANHLSLPIRVKKHGVCSRLNVWRCAFHIAI